MVTDSAIASLPHALVAAHKKLFDAVSNLPQCSTNAAFQALQAFVYEWRKVLEWSAELDRRATFIKNKCGNGSPWKRAADKAMAILSKPLKTNDPLRDFRLWAGIGAIRSGVGGTEQLRNVIDALDNEAISLRADGCQTLKHAYEDLEVESTNQSSTACILQAVPSMFPSICESETTSDDSAWVLISKLQPPRIPNVKERKRYIDKHPEIRSRPKMTKAGTPHPKRTEVHVGDWIKHWDKMDGQTFNGLDSADLPPITNDDLTEDFMDGATKLYSKVLQGEKSRP